MFSSYQDYIQLELERRKGRNSRYSLRSYAKDLGIAPPKLSQILNGKCGISLDVAKKLTSKLRLSSAEAEYFVTLVEAKHSRSQAARNAAKNRLIEIKANSLPKIDIDQFRLIADWYHFAILELSEITPIQEDGAAVAKRLGVSMEVAREAIQRLISYGFLRETEKGKFVQAEQDLATTDDVPSRELQEHHRQILQKASASLESTPVDEREFGSITMAIDSSKIQEAKQYIRSFQNKFCLNIQSSTDKDRVYCFAVQLFPLDQKGRKR